MERYKLNKKQVAKMNELQKRKNELMQEVELINSSFENLYFFEKVLYSSVPLESEDQND